MTAPRLLEETLEGRFAKQMSDDLFVDKNTAEYFLKKLKEYRSEVVKENFQNPIQMSDLAVLDEE